jgi:predicted ferric reductase
MVSLCVLLFFGRTYSIFTLSHHFLGLAIYILMYFHTEDSPWTSHRLYVVISLGVLWLNIAANMMFVAYRNSNPKDGGRLCRSSPAVVQRITYEDSNTRTKLSMPDAIYLHIQPTRPWKFRGAQVIYLRFIDLDWWSVVQSHPFYVAWWYKNSEGDDIAVCIVEKRRGLTKRLCAVDENATKHVLIDGPYGQNLRLHRFESILLFATGTGVTGLISIVAEIFKSPERSPVNLRQIVLIWELDYIRE